MTVTLLEATSHPDALSRARREARGGVPAYDPVPTVAVDRRRDRVSGEGALAGIEECALCGRAFVTMPGRGARVRFGMRFCSEKCAQVVYKHRYGRGLVA